MAVVRMTHSDDENHKFHQFTFNLQRMKASKCPTDELSLMNRAIVNPSDVMHEDKYIDVNTGSGHFIFAIERSPEVPQRNVGFSLLQRKWATLSINQVSL
jgi:vesicle-fusing ATPase